MCERYYAVKEFRYEKPLKLLKFVPIINYFLQNAEIGYFKNEKIFILAEIRN